MQHITKNEDFHAAVSADAGAKPVVACFSAPWCGGCKLVAPKVATLAEELAEEAAFIAVSAEQLEQLCEEVEVDSFPHFRVYKEGKILGDYTSSKFDKVEAFIREHVGPKAPDTAEETPEASVVNLTTEGETPPENAAEKEAEVPADATSEKEAELPAEAAAEKAAEVPVEAVAEKVEAVATEPATVTGEVSKKRSERDEASAESASTEEAGHTLKKAKTEEQVSTTTESVAAAVDAKATSEVVPPVLDGVAAEKTVSTDAVEVVEDALAA